MANEVPRTSSDSSLASSIRLSSRRSLLAELEKIEAAPPSPCRSAGRHQRSTPTLCEDASVKLGTPAALSRSLTSLPYVRFPLHPHNAAPTPTPPVPPLPTSPALSDISRRGSDAAQNRVVRTQQRYLRPSPRASLGLLPSPRPRSGSHNSDSNSSGSPSPNPSRPVSPTPFSPMNISTSPRPHDYPPTVRMPSFHAMQAIINQDTMDGMSDSSVQSLEEGASQLSLERSMSLDGSQTAPLERCVSAEPVLDSYLSLSDKCDQRRKRDLASSHSADRARLSQSTSNLPDLRAIDHGSDHFPSLLPRVSSSTQPDLWLVSPQTVNDLISGKFSKDCDAFYIVDCRFPYEFKGGHVRGAINLSNKDLVQEMFMSSEQRNTIIVFYCEFSSQRGPGSYHHLRNCDRHHNRLRYPNVWYPQTYVLQGGYKAFWETHPDSCEPRNYIPMHDDRYKDELRQCQMQSSRMRSKSFSCIELAHGGPTVPDSLLLRGSHSQQ